MRRFVILSVMLAFVPQYRGSSQGADDVELQVPLAGSISSVFDHSSVSQYNIDSTVVAFSGETGEAIHGRYQDCYQNRPQSRFVLYDNYVGVSGAGANRDTFLCYDGHPGIDIVASRGATVVAAANGTIQQVVNNIAPDMGTGYGNFVIIGHAAQITTLYGHLLTVANNPGFGRPWRAGDQILSGQTVGFVDSTGQSSGDHLHFEVRRSGLSVDPYGWKGWLLKERDPYSRSTANIDLWQCDLSVGADPNSLAGGAIELAFQSMHSAVAQRFSTFRGKEVMGCPTGPIRIGQQSFTGTVSLFQTFQNGASWGIPLTKLTATSCGGAAGASRASRA